MCNSLDMDYARIASDFLRVLRGKRSQTAFSRRLGYRSNVSHHWEHGLSWPTAAKALWCAERLGVDVRQAFRDFYRVPPRWLEEYDPITPQGVAAFLRDLKGHTSVVALARDSKKSRFSIARWLGGSSEPKLPEFLLMVECCSLRLLDFLEQLVDPRKLPSVSEQYKELQVARSLAYDEPWSQAVLRALELETYRCLPKHRYGWIAQTVGITPRDETRCLRRLADSRQIEWKDERWQLRSVMALDTRRDPEAARKLRAWWVRQSASRIEAGCRGLSYNLFGVSATDLERLRELQKAYLNEVRTIIARSEPVERVVLGVDLLLDLGERPSFVVGGPTPTRLEDKPR